MHAKRRFFFFLTSALLTATAACTLLLDRDNVQCSSNGDCAKFAATAMCVQSVCVMPDGAVVDSGQDATPLADVSQPDVADTGAVDSGPDAHFGAPGCFEGTPTTNEQFLNACSHADCVPFDNCARLGVCDGALPGVSPPDAGGSSSAPAADSGATELCSVVAANAQGVAVGSEKIVVVTGSSNFPPFLTTFAPVLAKSGYNVVWQTSNSCTGVDVIYNKYRTTGSPDPVKQAIREQKGRITLFYKADGSTQQCLLNGDTPVDVGESDIYAGTCTQNVGYDPTLVASSAVGEYLGPILPMTFIVPADSSQRVLSAEAGQVVFGRGRAPDASAPLPYNDPTQLFIRSSSTATNQIMSKGIFVDPTKWWGVDKGTASAMAQQMGLVAGPLREKTIGIISADFADTNRGNLRTLAFQARSQTCGFWPDSNSAAFDKRNVRDGHYPLWGPIHFFTELTGGIPSTVAAQNFVLRFSETLLDQELVESMVKSHVIPACAMNVTRDTEMGPVRAYDPPVHCGCFFDSIASNIATPPDGEGGTCKKCTSPADCANEPQRKTCTYGFCER